jgi:hypothetical protein
MDLAARMYVHMASCSSFFEAGGLVKKSRHHPKRIGVFPLSPLYKGIVGLCNFE